MPQSSFFLIDSWKPPSNKINVNFNIIGILNSSTVNISTTKLRTSYAYHCQDCFHPHYLRDPAEIHHNFHHLGSLAVDLLCLKQAVTSIIENKPSPIISSSPSTSAYSALFRRSCLSSYHNLKIKPPIIENKKPRKMVESISSVFSLPFGTAVKLGSESIPKLCKQLRLFQAQK